MADLHVTMMAEKVPATATGGSGGHVVLGSMLESLLLAAGLRLSACFVLEPSEQIQLARHPDRLQAWQAAGIATAVVPVQRQAATPHVLVKVARVLRRAGAPRLTDFYAAVGDREVVAAAVRRLRPDAIIGLPVTAMAGLYGTRIAPRLTIVSNFAHVVAYQRWRSTPPTQIVPFVLGSLRVMAARKHLGYMRAILADSEAVAANVYDQAGWLRQHGFPDCEYLPSPIADMAGPGWENRRSEFEAKRPKILMIGNLRGAATIPGLWSLVTEVLPRLEARLGADAFEVHIVGRDDPPPGLAGPLRRQSIVLRGYVEDATREFLSADVLLVPTPTADLGTRTRIVVGAAHGCCMVAHSANLVGAPEFEAGRDVLTADNGAALADVVVQALGDPGLRARLGRAARATYEREYAVGPVGRRLADALERLVRRHRS